MGVVINDAAKKPPIPVSEQTRIVEYVMDLVKDSFVFQDIPVSLNFIDSSRDCICVKLLEDSFKTAEYIDGSYEAQVAFMLIYRRLTVDGVDERLNAIDMVNQFGESMEEMEDFISDLPGITINYIHQREPAGTVYRSESGIEDNGAPFVLNYDHE